MKKENLNVEELKNKLYKILMSDNVVESIKENLGDLLEIIPEIKDMIGFQHNHPHHHLDVWGHTLLALSLSEKDFDIRLCLLLHEIGKPHSYQEREIRHFKGHPRVSKNISKNILLRLNFDKEYIDKICYLIKNHDKGIREKDIANNYDLELKRYKIQYCDTYAHNPEKIQKRVEYLDYISFLLNEYSPEFNSDNKSFVLYKRR